MQRLKLGEFKLIKELFLELNGLSELMLNGNFPFGKLRRGVPATFVGDRRQLLDVDIRTSDFLLGLFAKSHLPYEADIVPGVERTTPSLAEMTEKAIRFLEK